MKVIDLPSNFFEVNFIMKHVMVVLDGVVKL